MPNHASTEYVTSRTLRHTHPEQGLDFVAIDVETANRRRGSICSVGATVVRDGQVVETTAWLSQPPANLNWFDPFNVGMHGITAADVEAAPAFAESLALLVDVVSGLPVVAHNAAFDIGSIRDACSAESLPWPNLTYYCSLIMSRRALDLISYRLPVVAAELGVPLVSHHNAGCDSLTAASVVLRLAHRIDASNLDELSKRLGVISGHLAPNERSGLAGAVQAGHLAPPPGASAGADPNHPLFGHVFVFTGALGITRAEAWNLVASLGGIPERSVTKRTKFLVIGDGFTGNDPADFETGKAAKASMLRARVQRIEVLTEADLQRMLE